jgi:hypothetical protein
MKKGRLFQDIKENFGKKETELLEEFSFPVPGLPGNFTNSKAKINEGKMVFTR